MHESDKATIKWQRNILSLFGFLLPILAPLFGFLAYSKNGPHFWWSISATYYATSNILMIGVLGVVAFFLWTFKRAIFAFAAAIAFLVFAIAF